jgi:hypothetical protein
MKVTKIVIDEQLVRRSTEKANRRNLFRAGGMVRRQARQSIRAAPKVDVATGLVLGRGRRRKGVVTRDAIAPAGAPPYRHAGDVLRNFLLFAVEGSSAVVIGPTPVGGKPGTAPRALEEGGPSLAVTKRGLRPRTIRARPFMLPALAGVLPQIGQLWANSVRA